MFVGKSMQGSFDQYADRVQIIVTWESKYSIKSAKFLGYIFGNGFSITLLLDTSIKVNSPYYHGKTIYSSLHWHHIPRSSEKSRRMPNSGDNKLSFPLF